MAFTTGGNQPATSPSTSPGAKFGARELVVAGISLRQLVDSGVPPSELRAAGFEDVNEFLTVGVSVKELVGAGFTQKILVERIVELKAAGAKAPEFIKAMRANDCTCATGLPPRQA